MEKEKDAEETNIPYSDEDINVNVDHENVQTKTVPSPEKDEKLKTELEISQGTHNEKSGGSPEGAHDESRGSPEGAHDESGGSPENAHDDGGPNDEDSKRLMIEEIKSLLAENEKIKKENEFIQNKLSTTFFNKPTDKLNFQEIKLPIEANEDTYDKILETIENISTETEEFSSTCEEQLITLKESLQGKEVELTELSNHFYEKKENVALKAVNSATGERFAKEDVRQLLEKEENQNGTMLQFRLKSIREKHALDKAIKRKRMLADAEGALNFADFETMVTELQNNKVKIPRVRKEVEILETKCQNVINVMSHLCQKLHFFLAEKATTEVKMKLIAEEKNKMQKTLENEKVQYNKKKAENEELQHKFLLLQHPELIEDYKEAEVKLKEGNEMLNAMQKNYIDIMEIISRNNN